MARLPRLDLEGIPQHIIQRGNNRDVCFVSESDYAAYLYWLEEAAKKYGVAIHAWVLMTNHVHLLATPSRPQAISKMMQSLGRQYVRYYNYTYRRSGTLWEGRFKSCLVDSESYLLECYRYIELNPVRAGMVQEPSEYRWSSYCANGLGKSGSLCSPHEKYLALGLTEEVRLEHYRALFRHQLDTKLVDDLREVTQKGLALGNSDFIEKVEQLSKRRATSGKPGRPKKK